MLSGLIYFSIEEGRTTSSSDTYRDISADNESDRIPTSGTTGNGDGAGEQ